MSNIEKLINLQRRFEQNTKNLVHKEDYTSFEKVVEDFIIEAGRLNPDINVDDLLKRHLSKTGKIRDQRGALQLMNSVISDITILKNSVNESNDHLNEDKESLEKINQVFDTFKGEVNELLKDYEDDMKDNFEDEFKKLIEKLDSRFHEIMSSDDYVAFDKEEKVISSMFIDFCDELNTVVAGCLNAFKSNCVNASNRFKAGMRGVRSLTDREVAEQGVKRFIDSILTMVKNIERSKSFSKEYEKKYRRSFEEIINNHIWNGDMQFASGSKKLEEKLRDLLFKDDIFSMGVTSDILRNIALSVNGVDISKDKLLTRAKSEDLVRESKQRLLNKVERYGESYKEVAEHSILPIFYNLRNDTKSITDLSTLKKNFISYTEKAENGGTYSKFLESYKKDILSAVDSFCKDFTKITDIKIDSEQRNFESKINDILKKYSDIFPYGTDYFFNHEIKDKLSDYSTENVDVIKEVHEAYSEEIADIFYNTIYEDIKKEIENLTDKLNNFVNENMNKVNESEDQVTKELERIINQSIDDAYEYSANVYSSIIYHLDDLQKDRVNLDDYDIAGLVEDKFYEYAGEYDIAYSKHIKKYADKVVDILGKAGVNQGQVKQIIDRYDSMFPGGVDGIGKYFDSKISPLIKDFDRHGSLDKLIKSLEREEEIFSNEVSASLYRLGDELKELVSGELNENDTTIIKPINESRVNKGRRYYQKSLYLNESGALASKLGKKVKSLGQDICDEDNNPYYDDIFMAYYTVADKGVEYLKKGKAKDFHRDFEKLIDKANADIQLLYIKSINAYSSEVYDAITEYVDMYNEIAGRGDDNDDLLRDEESDTKKEIDRIVEDTIGKVIFELKSIKSISSRDIKKSYTDDVTFKNEDEEEDIKLWSGNMTDDLVTYIINLHQTSLVPKIQNLVSKLGNLSESRRDIFFEAEEEKKPKISKEEKEKLKAQLDNFFADKKEAKATELKKSIADRDKAIEDVILKYSTEKEKIQREYSKNIQVAKSEAEANKLRAERDEELQRLSLEKATSIEDLKERQKKEEASIREKYQTLFDKKLEEYKDSLGDTISDFAKDIEDGIRKNPIFQ